MGQIVNVTRNAEQLQGFLIESSADMHTVLAWGESKGYRGHINLDASGVWTIGLTAPGGDTAQSGRVGDWVILKNDTVATIVPAEQAPSLYTVAG